MFMTWIDEYKNMPEEYDIFRVHLTAVQQWDNVPTFVVNQAMCVMADGTEVVVGLATWNHTKVRRVMAIFRYGSFFKNLFLKRNRPLPRVGFEIVLHDLAAYLTMSKLVYSMSTAVNVGKQQFRFDDSIPLTFVLGDPEFALAWDDYFHNDLREDGYRKTYLSASLTLEQQGVVERQFFAEQKAKREKLGLWQKKSIP